MRKGTLAHRPYRPGVLLTPSPPALSAGDAARVVNHRSGALGADPDVDVHQRVIGGWLERRIAGGWGGGSHGVLDFGKFSVQGIPNINRRRGRSRQKPRSPPAVIARWPRRSVSYAHEEEQKQADRRLGPFPPPCLLVGSYRVEEQVPPAAPSPVAVQHLPTDSHVAAPYRAGPETRTLASPRPCLPDTNPAGASPPSRCPRGGGRERPERWGFGRLGH
jgi:hypothetical protein